MIHMVRWDYGAVYLLSRGVTLYALTGWYELILVDLRLEILRTASDL